MSANRPDFLIENSNNAATIGFDEAGRGPLAGPVVAACVYVPENIRGLSLWAQVNDSKKLSKALRSRLFQEIQAHCHWGVGQADAGEIDQINILQASFLAMERAYKEMIKNAKIPGTHIALIDGNRTPKTFPIRAQSIIKGDSKSLSIAAASILAKVTRDDIMEELAQEYPHYGWESNAAYPTKTHLEALEIHGITEHHRRSYAPVKKMLERKVA